MSGVDDPDEIDRAAAALAAAERRLGEEENKLRSQMSILKFKSIDPGGRSQSEFAGAVKQINQARTTFQDLSKSMRRAAQELRNARIR